MADFNDAYNQTFLNIHNSITDSNTNLNSRLTFDEIKKYSFCKCCKSKNTSPLSNDGGSHFICNYCNSTFIIHKNFNEITVSKFSI